MVYLFFLVSLWRGRGRYVSILRPTQIGFGAEANRTTTGEPTRAHAEQQGGFAENIGLLFARVPSKSLPFDLCKAVKQQQHISYAKIKETKIILRNIYYSLPSNNSISLEVGEHTGSFAQNSFQID